MLRISHQFVIKLVWGQCDFVEIAALAEMHPQWNHLDIELIEFCVRNVRSRVGDDRYALTPGVLTGVLLTNHVVGFLVTDFAKSRR